MLSTAHFVNSQKVYFNQKVSASNRKVNDQFGWSVSLSNNIMAVGTPIKLLSDGFKLHQYVGSVYIYKKVANGKWQQTQIIEPLEVSDFMYFGGSVTISDKFLIVGAEGDNDPKYAKTSSSNRRGSVFVYKIMDNGKYYPFQKLRIDSLNSNDNFGREISVSDTLMAVSAPTKTLTSHGGSGVVTIFKHSLRSNRWEIDTMIQAPKGTEFFGIKINIFRNKLFISDKDKFLFVFEKNSIGKWEFKEKLIIEVPSHSYQISSISSNNLGVFIGMDGEYDFNTTKGSSKYQRGEGAVCFYSFENGKYKLKQIIKPLDIKANSHFGTFISVNDKYLSVTALGDNNFAGAVYVYKIQNGKTVFLNKLNSTPLNADKFGFSTSLHGNEILIGSRFEGEDALEKNNLSCAGAAYVYEIK